jgi:hypothetical protein
MYYNNNQNLDLERQIVGKKGKSRSIKQMLKKDINTKTNTY